MRHVTNIGDSGFELLYRPRRVRRRSWPASGHHNNIIWPLPGLVCASLYYGISWPGKFLADNNVCRARRFINFDLYGICGRAINQTRAPSPFFRLFIIGTLIIPIWNLAERSERTFPNRGRTLNLHISQLCSSKWLMN